MAISSVHPSHYICAHGYKAKASGLRSFTCPWSCPLLASPGGPTAQQIPFAPSCVPEPSFSPPSLTAADRLCIEGPLAQLLLVDCWGCCLAYEVLGRMLPRLPRSACIMLHAASLGGAPFLLLSGPSEAPLGISAGVAAHNSSVYISAPFPTS